MLRTFIVTNKERDLASLRSSLLDARLRGAQADAAMEQVKMLNPHADLTNLKEGMVLFVPRSSAFKAPEATSPPMIPVDDFRALVAAVLNTAASTMKAGNAARAAERAGVAAALKSDAFKRLAGDDKIVAQQAEDAQKAIAAEEGDDKKAEESFAAMSKAALAAAAELSKLAG